MKRYVIGLCALLLAVGAVKAEAQTNEPQQDIVVTNFQRAVTDMTARVNPVYDNNGEACAIIKFSVRDTTYVIEPNLGFVKRECKVGEIRLWVPAGTKRLTVRHEGMFPLRDYVIPEPIESKAAYHAYLWSTISAPVVEEQEPIVEKEENPIVVDTPKVVQIPEQEVMPPVISPTDSSSSAETSKTRFFLGAGYVIMPQSGLSVTMGVNANHHIVEAGAAMTLGMTDSLHYYHNDAWCGSYQYRLMKISLRYGYEYRTKGKTAFAYTPMIGINGALALGSGEHNVNMEIGKKHALRDGMALSVSAAVRLGLCVGDYFAVFVKPEYSVAAYKSDSYKLMMRGRDTFKKWAEGFALETGVVITF